MTYAFTFDATFCSGCKACQAACKDKNNLPLGVLWRRVYEVTGGAWEKEGEVWHNTVFAYNLSVACNHCIHPKCAGICPTNAYVVREDGIVILDTTKCMGCGYCAWACPYGVPQYNAEAGHMSKCNFCYDSLEQGLPPACVAACPLRVLDYVETSVPPVPAANEIRLWDSPSETHPYPLPNYSHTQPRVAIKPHPAMNRAVNKFVANREEIRPRLPSAWEDVPLILFTLFMQMAVGGFWAMLWTFPFLWTLPEGTTSFMEMLPLVIIGFCLATGMLASFAHLGTKRKAVFALRNLRRSWLSREVLFTGLFGIAWLLTGLEALIWQRSMIEWAGLTAALGLGLVYSMAQVYRLCAVPAWNSWRTNAGFLVSALLLGQSMMSMLLSFVSTLASHLVPFIPWTTIGGLLLILLLAQLALVQEQFSSFLLYRIRIGLVIAAIVLTFTSSILIGVGSFWISLLIFLIVITEEGLGRWSFYRART